MKYIFSTILTVLAFNTFSQTYKDSISFKSDLWVAETFEEGLRTPNDTISVNWVKKNLPSSKPIIYIDVSEYGSVVGIKYPIKLGLYSSNLPNNGYLGKTVLKSTAMYEQCNVLDETGYLWNVIVGKDGSSEIPEKRDEGRIYIVIQDPKGLKSSYYFTLKTFGGRKTNNKIQ